MACLPGLFLSSEAKMSAPYSATPEMLQSLSQKFAVPTDEYRPYVFWHWLGTNFSKEGITKDLEAMKEAGIGGAVIFNLAGDLHARRGESFCVYWSENTYRSPAYWEALQFAASEARRLGLKIGIHNSPGYSATGGPWISEEQGMQKIVSSQKKIKGNQSVKVRLAQPELPVSESWNAPKDPAVFYRDIAVMAVPTGAEAGVSDVMDITAQVDADGNLSWQAPAGEWMVYRIGHAPTMRHSQPVPLELYGKCLEVDKMSREANIYHWQQMLNPLVEHLKEYIGNSFSFIHIDSYESDRQDWTHGFRDEFIRLKGYDPLPWIALRLSANSGRDDLRLFDRDYSDVVNRLFIDNGWKTATEMIHAAGLQFYWEPYTGPFDTEECVSLPDVPMGEFWTYGSSVTGSVVQGAKRYNKRIVAAEAFTGRTDNSRYTENPAFLKYSADVNFASGINWMFLHHWVHQPFDDKYQPMMSMGYWGTHFGRFQTWFKPGKAFFTYLSRCQMLLQQGTGVESTANWGRRSMPEADIFFAVNPTDGVKKTYAFPVNGRVPELWDAYLGTISRTGKWREEGDSVYVDLNLQPGESMFVIFPYRKGAYPLLPDVETVRETFLPLTGAWKVTFQPKLEQPFLRNLPALVDFSRQKDGALKYFSGTAKYEKNVRIAAADLGEGKRLALDLGELHDIAELEVNGQNVGVLWSPPYKMDITPYVKAGNNQIAVYVTNNWANRLIGDEQYPPDFEWGKDHGEKTGREMKVYPDWFLNNQTRPSKGRKTFNSWYYFRQDSPLQPAGLLGPVRIIRQHVKIL